jgi:hypothetical protein
MGTIRVGCAYCGGRRAVVHTAGCPHAPQYDQAQLRIAVAMLADFGLRALARIAELEAAGSRLLPEGEGSGAVLPFPLPAHLLSGSSRGLLAQEEEGTDYACGGVCC